nr:aldehyde dehydrogenase family protein [Streptomyces katrae]
MAGAARNLPGAAAAEYTQGRTSLLRREPVGVCAQITPWNYPLMRAAWKSAPAIAAGNTTVLKPADTTPSSSTLLARIASAHMPPGVLNVVCADRETGRALTAHRDVALIAVTGSVRARQEIAAAAVACLKRVHLELGGNSPVIVHDDVDGGATAAALCRRLLQRRPGLHRAHAAPGPPPGARRVPRGLRGIGAKMRTDPPSEPDAGFGPLDNAARLASVRAKLDRLPAHAGIVTGGARLARPGFFVEPTVMAGVRQDDETASVSSVHAVSSVRLTPVSTQSIAPAPGPVRTTGALSGSLPDVPRAGDARWG